MNEETVNQETLETTAEEPERTFTQTELDAIVRDRLQREHNKYADFETYKEKAEKYDAAEEAQKSELQKVTERADTLQKQPVPCSPLPFHLSAGSPVLRS